MSNRIMITNEYVQAHQRKRLWQKVVAAMAAVVVFCTTYALILPAITETNAMYCGFEEAHGDACYETERLLTCQLEESEGHEHSDACYSEEKHLICEKPIHEHTLQCFSDPEADVESQTAWDSMMADVKLTGDWGEDVIRVAKSQLGYQESRRNYSVLEDGVTTKGYTRYGDRYGSPYGDWSAMFCAFCLDYAGLKDHPTDADCGSWIAALSSDEGNPERRIFYHEEGSYQPKPGDLIFFDLGAEDSCKDSKAADRVGFVLEVTEDANGAPAQVKTIEGDHADKVACCTYDADSRQILGYGELPENPDQIVDKSVAMDNGVQVTVSAPNSSLPYPARDIELTAELVTDSEAEEIITSCLKEEGIGCSDMMLIDVCLKHQGLEIEPTGPVTLTFDAGSVINAAAVYHVDERNETITDMNADITADGLATMETDHFSTFALANTSAKSVTADVNATWDQTAEQFSSITITARSSDLDKCYFGLSANDGSDWTMPGSWSTQTAKNRPATVPVTALSSADAGTEFRVLGSTSTTAVSDKNSGYSASFTMTDLCESEKAGFKEWLQNCYVQFFGGLQQPETLTELYGVFSVYYELPTLTVDSTFNNNNLTLTASTDFQGTPNYKWEYYDTENGSWITMQGETGAVLNASNYPELNGGRDVRCSLYDGTILKAMTVSKNVDPLRKLYDNAIDAINAGLDLAHFKVLVGGNTSKGTSFSYSTITVDVSIHGDKYDKYFYWGNLANDPDLLTVTDGDSFADYLAGEYLKYDDPDEGLDRVNKIWNRYIYDIYDPLSDSGYKADNSGNYLLNGNADGKHDYGDATITYVKDATSTSFHGTLDYEPLIDPLNYNYLENGVDYKNFVSGLDKTARAVKAGDSNTERKYLLDITADAQAKAAAPVAMVVTIQTSWQMFDLEHANALKKGDGGYGDFVANGAAAHSTELANLYAIKQALLDFVDYMESEYPGNNLVLGVTEFRHDKDQTMLLGKDANNNPLYVSNNYEVLRQSIMDWDTFGNCEHVHYTDGCLKAAWHNLEENLSGWKDSDGLDINYDNIRKAAVVIGGPTENSNGTNGYACVLPWASFQTDNVNSVYGIRANNGTPISGAPVISWIDYSGNNTGNAYADGTGTSFTDKYVATTRQAMLDSLIDIAEREMTSYGLDIINDSKYIDDFTVNDTVTDEFLIDSAVPFTATIYNSGKYGSPNELGKKNTECVIDWQTGMVTRTTYTAGMADGAPQQIQGIRTVTTDAQNNRTTAITFSDADGDHTLMIVEKASGTSDVTYDFDRVYNTKKCNLNFGIVAKEDYIGSNNVYTNVGTPDLYYKHYHLDDDGQVELDPETGNELFDGYDRNCKDTPEVNVPIRFTTTDGDLKKVLLNTEVDLGTDPDLNSHIITAAVEDLVDNYDQINGKLQYTWVLPDGTRIPCGSVDIDSGIAQDEFPSLEHIYQANTVGMKECRLEVTFTPDAFENNPNFMQDGVTDIEVSKVMHPGSVWIEAVDAGTRQNYYVRKEWKPETPTGISSVDFRLSDGAGGYVKQGASGYEITSNEDDATEFQLNAAGSWQSLVTGLPTVKTVNGQTVILNYQAEEINIPDGYEVSYGSSMQTDEEWQGYLSVTLSPTSQVRRDDAKYLHIKFRYNGATYESDLPMTLAANISGGDMTTVDFRDILLPLNGRQPIGDISIESIFTYKEINKKGEYVNMNSTLLANSTAEAVPVMTGSVKTPVLVMTNSEEGQRLKLVKTNHLGQFLSGAEFALYASDSGGNKLDMPMAGYENMVSGGNGEFTPTESFSLPYGTYYLVETKVPDGYIAPETPVKFTVDTNGITVMDGNAQTARQDGIIIVTVKNWSGHELPKSGGAGTTMFTLVGLLMMAGAVMLGYAVRRRGER